MLSHNVNESERAGDIVVVVFPRLSYGFAHCFKTCEMYYGVDFLVLEDVFHSITVENVREIEFYGLACDFFNSFKGFAA